MSEKLTVIIPCLNEERNIGATVEAVVAVAPSLPVEVEVLLIDDGSKDGTLVEMHGLREAHGCRIVVNERNLGLGRSVMNAYEVIDPESWVTVFPGDNEFYFEPIADFLNLRDRYDIVLGYYENPVIRPFRRRLASTAFTRIVNALYGFPYRYLNGMKLYRVKSFKGIEVRGSGHAYMGELLAKAVLRDPRLRVGEAPFITKGRHAAGTKAYQPKSIAQAMQEVWVGVDSVSRWREEMIAARAEGRNPALEDLDG